MRAAYCWVSIAPSDEQKRTQMRARCLLVKGGLAITERENGLYSITHLATGFCIGGDQLTKAKAREVIAKLLPLADWTGETSYLGVSLRKLKSIGGIVKNRSLVGWK
jgi:hypothetical protein